MRTYSFCILLLVALYAFTLPKKITVWLIGDSTIAIKEVKHYPETGWGMPFAHFFDSAVQVQNHAKNGRSTKSFRAEGLWQPVEQNVKPGDYVFIQFGHNDEVKEKVGRYTTPQEFKENLTHYVNETKARKAFPVLVTPVARRQFDAAGRVKESHPVYAQLVLDVAKELVVPVIDLNNKSKQLLQQMGPEASKYLYNHLDPQVHPNYPDGRADDTHFSEMGARKMAEIVLAEIKALQLPLASHIYKPTK